MIIARRSPLLAQALQVDAAERHEGGFRAGEEAEKATETRKRATKRNVWRFIVRGPF
jgi:hypothetical protein